jgi:dihydrofolate reductase
MIAAVSPDGVIGIEGKIPWRHPGDLRRFQRVTTGGVVIMGRLTWESMNRRPLPKRRNIVLSRSHVSGVEEGVEHYADIASALTEVAKDPSAPKVWFIGGARIYEEAMAFCDVIDLTYVPDRVPVEGAVMFPAIDPALFDAGPLVDHEDEPGLTRRIFTRRASA